MLNRTTIIRVTTRNGVLPMTLEQCTMQAHQLAVKVKAADAALLAERVRLGAMLLQVRGHLKRGEWGIWLAAGMVHQKIAERCMRHAAELADAHGELDKQKLFDCLHAADPEMFPDIDLFDEHRVSLARVDRAIATREADEWTAGLVRETPNRMGRSTRASIISGEDGAEASVGVGVVGGLPRARVGDVAGQGVLVELFRPFAQRLETFATRYDGFDDTKRRRAREIIDRCDRDLAELMDIQQRPPRDGGAHGSPSVPPFIASSHLGADQDRGG